MPREWTVGLFDCTRSVPWCFITFCFPCVTSYKVGTKLGLKCAAISSVLLYFLISGSSSVSQYAISKGGGNIQGLEGLDLGQGEEFGAGSQYDAPLDEAERVKWSTVQQGSAIVTLAAALLFWLALCKMRTHMRANYDLEGHGCTDCCLVCICTPCALCQMYNQLEVEDEAGTATAGDRVDMSRA